MHTPRSRLYERGAAINARLDEVGEASEGAAELLAGMQRLSAHDVFAALYHHHAEGERNERTTAAADEWMAA